MANCISRYKKAVKKNLRCTHNTKSQLSQKFDAMLSAFLEDNLSPSTDELYAAFGLPQEMATVLMEGVSAEENSKYRKTRLITKAIAGIVAGVLLTLVIAFTWYIYIEKQAPVIHDDEVYVEDSPESADGIIVEDEIIVED